MKELCTKKKYDLSQLNDEQLQIVLDLLKKNDTNWDITYIWDFKRNSEEFNLFYEGNLTWHWGNGLENTTNALELFEEEPNCCEIVVNSMGRVEPKYPNYSFDKSDVYESAHNLIEKGKQHGLKIVVTFEKLQRYDKARKNKGAKRNIQR